MYAEKSHTISPIWMAREEYIPSLGLGQRFFCGRTAWESTPFGRARVLMFSFIFLWIQKMTRAGPVPASTFVAVGRKFSSVPRFGTAVPRRQIGQGRATGVGNSPSY